MVLSNAERQARYRQRLKAAASEAKLSEAKVALLQDFRRRIADSRERLELLQAGRYALFETLPGGARRDLTSDAIAREEAVIAEYEQLLQLYDPQGVTLIADEEDDR